MDDRHDKNSFEQRLAAAEAGAGRKKTETTHKSVGSGYSAVNLAMRLGVELVAALVIAVIIGWGLDKLFGTRPWFMVVMVPVGMAAGLRNLVRATGPKQGRDG